MPTRSWIWTVWMMVIVAWLPAVAARAAEAPVQVAEPHALVGWMELSESLREGPVPFAWVSPQDAGPSLADVLGQIRTVTEDERYRGLVVYLDQPMLTMTQVVAIADAITAARAKGRTVLAFAEAYDMQSYLVACACDQILLRHKGSVAVYGMAVEEMYLAGMLTKIGVSADLVQIGKYKGADETMTRSGPSEPWSENIDGLLDDMYDQVLARIMAGRKMTRQEAEALVADAWGLSDGELVARRVVDQLTDRDLVDVTEIAFGDRFDWDDAMGRASGNAAMPNNPFALFQMLFQNPANQPQRATIAVIHGAGPIHMGESSAGDGMFSSESIGAGTMTRVLGEVRDNDLVKGVVLRIDSPGGSALASEIIWQAVREVAEIKPVFLCVGSMAASGGYYIACGADQVYVNEQSILGSIGVVGGKLTLGGLYGWAGITVHRRSRGGNADIFNSVEPFTEAQRASIRGSMKQVYDQFTDRVARGRGKRLPDVSKVAEGRLFTGRQAVANGMADRLGGTGRAVADLAAELGMAAGSFDVIDLPRPVSLQEFLGAMFSASAPVTRAGAPGGVPEAAAVGTVRRLLGPAAWRSVSRSIDGMLLLRDEPVLMLMPQAVVVR